MATFRPGEHGDRLLAPKMEGAPEKPAGMDRDAARLWDLIVPQLVESKIVKRIDSTALRAMCEMWVLYRKAFTLAKVDPCDKDVRGAVVAYWSAFDKAAAHLCIPPSERAKLCIPPEAPKDGISAFTRKRG